MSEYNIDIADMQCWVFRMAQSKWKMSPSECFSTTEVMSVFLTST